MSEWIRSAFRGKKTYLAAIFMVAGGVWIIWVLKDYSKGIEMICEGLMGAGFRSFLSRHIHLIHAGLKTFIALQSIAQQQAAETNHKIAINTNSSLTEEEKKRLEAEFLADQEKLISRGPANRLGGIS